MVPFTAEVYFSVFAQYNAAIWPAQAVACALGGLAVALTLRPRGGANGIIAAVLAGAWLWTGVVYHTVFLSTIIWAAWGFGALFVVQGSLFTRAALGRRLRFRFRPDPSGWTGLGLAVHSLAVHPFLGWLGDRDWIETTIFGVAPAPTVLFTLGMLVLAEARVPPYLVAIPLLWSLIGGAAAWQVGAPEDLVLPLAGVAGICLVVWKNRRLAVGERR